MALNTIQSSSLHSVTIALQHNILAPNKEEKKASFTLQYTLHPAPAATTRDRLENSITLAKPKATPALLKQH